MKNLILTLLTAFLFTFSSAQAPLGNWQAGGGSIHPSGNLIPASAIVTLNGDFRWFSTQSFINNNHLSRFVMAFPPSLVVDSAITKITVNNVVIPATVNRIITTGGSSIYWTFPANTTFPPNCTVNLMVDSIKVKNDQAYILQAVSHFVDFIAAPAESAYNDNLGVRFFDTFIDQDTPLPIIIDTTVFEIKEPKLFMEIYPNPTKGTLKLDYELDRDGVLQIDLVDISGKILSSEKVRAEKGAGFYYMYLDGLPKGIYVLKIYKNNSVFLVELINKI